MNKPDLTRIVECHVAIKESLETHLRRDVLTNIRALQQGGRLRWFSFLVHAADQLAGDVPHEGGNVLHLRLEPRDDLAVAEFIAELPPMFRHPMQVTLGTMAGVELGALRDGDWAHAWRMLGISSEWVLCFLETHPATLPLEHVAQFLHFITNPLGLGHSCQLIMGRMPSF